MIDIIFYDGVSDPVYDNAESLEQWCLNKWKPGEQVPRGLRIFINEVSEENDITDKWFKDTSLLQKDGVTYIVAIMPSGGVVGAITKVIGALLNPIIKLLVPRTGATNPNMKNQRISSSNNALAGRTNEPRPGERIEDIYGHVRAYPTLLMDYRIFHDRTEYEVQLLCLGRGEYQITDIRDGMTPASNISGTDIEIYKPNSSPGNGSPYLRVGNPIDLNKFPIMVARSSNEADGSELRPPNYNDLSKLNLKIYNTGQIDTISSQTIEWADRASIGNNIELKDCYSWQKHVITDPITGSETISYVKRSINGLYKTLTLSDNLLIVDNSSSSAWQYLSSSGTNMIREAWRDPSTGRYQFNDFSGGVKETYNPSIDAKTPFSIGPYLVENADQIMVNLYAQNGIYKTDGDVYPFSVNCRMTLTDPDDPTAPAINHDVRITGKFTDAVGATLKVNNPYKDRVNVTMRRLDYTDKGFEGSVVDSIKWRDLYAVTDIPPQEYGNVTIIQAVTKSTVAAIKQKERKLNMDVVRIVDGQPKKNFADVIKAMHTDPFVGRRSLNTLDMEDLYRVEKQMLNYYGDDRSVEVGYTFDNVSVTYEEALSIVGNTVNCMPYQIGNNIYFWPELPQEISNMQFGHTFKIPGSDKRTRSFESPKGQTGVQVKYFSHETLTYQFVNVGDQTNLMKIDLQACQSRYLANIKANRENNKLKYQRITHDTVLSSIGLQCSPGMRIDMVDNTRTLQNDGRVEYVEGNVLTLSDPFNYIEGVDYTITITGRLGKLENIPIEKGESDFEVILKSPASEEIYTGWMKDKTSYVIKGSNNFESLAMLVQSVEPNGKDDAYTVKLNCVNYDARYYQNDKGA